jgi:hypothetical protein
LELPPLTNEAFAGYNFSAEDYEIALVHLEETLKE